MIRIIILFFVAITLSGCVATYSLAGKKYENEESFQSAVESRRELTLSKISPLPKPLTTKKLIVSIPSEQAIYDENERRHVALTGRSLMGIGVEQNRNLSKANYKLARVFFEGVEKRKIYSDVVIKDAPTVVTSLEPSAEYDVIYYTEPGVGSGQYFYASAKYGKQVFAYDRSATEPGGKVKAFIEALQSLVIRE